ncbi:MAG: 50S ribosomal protein L11 methyltransferase [Rikenellaceae bacterium]
MDYIEFILSSNKMMSEEESGVYIAFLCDFGFDSFREEGKDLFCYITYDQYLKNKIEIDKYLSTISLTISKSDVEKKDWNAVWESHFEPIVVNDKCVVRAPFHDPYGVEKEIVIMPKMSFGTGHHQTTRLMMEAILNADLAYKKCLDMGCGTAVLSILAVKCGAESVDAIDIDEWAYENGVENVSANGVSDKINMFCGDASLLKSQHYDVIFANINRNILLKDINRYAQVLNNGGDIYMSGFLEEDVDMILEAALKLGLRKKEVVQKDKWSMVKVGL